MSAQNLSTVLYEDDSQRLHRCCSIHAATTNTKHGHKPTAKEREYPEEYAQFPPPNTKSHQTKLLPVRYTQGPSRHRDNHHIGRSSETPQRPYKVEGTRPTRAKEGAVLPKARARQTGKPERL